MRVRLDCQAYVHRFPVEHAQVLRLKRERNYFAEQVDRQDSAVDRHERSTSPATMRLSVMPALDEH